MRRLVVAALALLLFGLPASAAAQPASGLEVTAWVLPSTSNAVVARNAPGMTTLAVSSLMLRASGGGVTPVTGSMLRLANAGHENGLTTELSVSNYSNRIQDFDADALHTLLSHRPLIDQVVAQLAADVRRGPWDGVNIDFEIVREVDSARLVTLLSKLQAAMPPAKTVSIDVSAVGTTKAYLGHGYRLGGIAANADVIDLMAYDYSGPGWSAAGPIGPLGWQRRCLDAMLAVVPAQKVQLGVAGYGYTWPVKGTGVSLSDRQARDMVANDGATAVWMPDEGEWTATLSDGTVLWWSDAQSYALRVDLAKEYHLRGTAVWRVGSADTLH